MIEAVLTTCAAIETCIKALTAAVKYIVNLNYEIVTSAVTFISTVISAIVSFYYEVKHVVIFFWDSLVKIFTAGLSLIKMVIDMIQVILYFSQMCCSYLKQLRDIAFHYIFHIFFILKQCILDILKILESSSVLNSLYFAINSFTAALTTIKASISLKNLYEICVHFVTEVWQGLGFVLSSVAYFPMCCMQCFQDIAENSWKNLTQKWDFILNAITKETYLCIFVVCLLYLILSNAARYLTSRGLTLFPLRSRHRRERRTNLNWDFDQGFESDFEDAYGSDNEGVSLELAEVSDSESGSNASEESNYEFSDSDSDDEYTIVSDESDSDASINSQTFSTESSDHEIDVQLPPVEEHYSLRNRASTPSHISKVLSTPEDFNREMEKERDKRKCVICQDEIKCVLVLPCKHLCMCVHCANQIVRSHITGRRICPLCRCKITKVMNIYV